MTLEELLKDRTLPVKVKYPYWPSSWVNLEKLLTNGDFVGVTNGGSTYVATPDTVGLELYTEPKIPRVMYQAVWKYLDRNDIRLVGTRLYQNEAEARGDLKDCFVRLMTETPIEVPSE